jgi:hypothetical protein
VVSLKSGNTESHDGAMAASKAGTERPTMRTFHYVSSKLIIAAIACGFVASTPIQGMAHDNARLIINRSADFGINESINLTIDGVQVAVLGINQNYDAALPPGKHVVSITTNPKTYPEQAPAYFPVNAEPSKTYTFTAVWDDSERASLVER